MPTRSRRLARLIALGVTVGLLLVACGSSTPSATAGGSATGGPLAEALVRKMATDPLVVHVEQTATANGVVAGATRSLTGTISGDISGKDVALHLTAAGNGQSVDQEIVVVGDTAYTRRNGGAWSSGPSSATAASIDGLIKAIRLIDDPAKLRDVGVETVDGVQLHHLVGAGIPYQPASGGTGHYDAFDIWVTDDGTPVKAKTTFSATDASGNATTGTTDLAYSKFGGPLPIVAPSVVPSAAPPNTAPSPAGPSPSG